MSYKFFYLFLIGGFVSLALLVYEVVVTYPKLDSVEMMASIIPAAVLFYLAYKVWHEKNDSELM